VPSDERGPLLVVAAHPDDEALGFAGIIATARAAGRRVVVAVVTNGDSTMR
jgi:LmbE family N-acetylglucosaminyl deacetylase